MRRSERKELEKSSQKQLESIIVPEILKDDSKITQFCMADKKCKQKLIGIYLNTISIPKEVKDGCLKNVKCKNQLIARFTDVLEDELVRNLRLESKSFDQIGDECFKDKRCKEIALKNYVKNMNAYTDTVETFNRKNKSQTSANRFDIVYKIIIVFIMISNLIVYIYFLFFFADTKIFFQDLINQIV